jgi:glycosyltransferase involved in cell wall biosynthesis
VLFNTYPKDQEFTPLPVALWLHRKRWFKNPIRLSRDFLLLCHSANKAIRKPDLDLLHTGQRKCITTIYNPIVTPELQCKAQVPLEHPWFTPGAPPVVLGAGRLRLQKDFPTLVRAFARARAVREMRLMILDGRQDERKEASIADACSPTRRHG